MLKYEDKEPDEYLSWIFAQIRKKDGLNYKQKVSKQKCTVNTAKICERMFGGRGLNAKDLTITLLNTKPRYWTNF